MIRYSTVTSNEELEGIHTLLQKNLGSNLTPEEKTREGYLTVYYSPEDLRKMHDAEPGIIAKENDQVVAYVLAMTPGFRSGFPVLEPLFKLFDQIIYENKPVSSYHYLIVGQACIDKNYRGKGLLRKLYAAYARQFSVRYDFAISEIASKNLRSMNAHKRMGFFPVHEYNGPDGVQWTIVLLDWRHIEQNHSQK